MQGKIDAFGNLLLLREGFGSEFLPQSCFFSQPPRSCSIYCPLFGEPYKTKVSINSKVAEGWTLTLCKTSLFLTSLKIEPTPIVQGD